MSLDLFQTFADERAIEARREVFVHAAAGEMHQVLELVVDAYFAKDNTLHAAIARASSFLNRIEEQSK